MVYIVSLLDRSTYGGTTIRSLAAREIQLQTNKVHVDVPKVLSSRQQSAWLLVHMIVLSLTTLE